MFDHLFVLHDGVQNIDILTAAPMQDSSLKNAHKSNEQQDPTSVISHTLAIPVTLTFIFISPTPLTNRRSIGTSAIASISRVVRPESVVQPIVAFPLAFIRIPIVQYLPT
jgi:hypothetical protein